MGGTTGIRQMKRLPKRGVDLCKGCNTYRFCSWRIQGTQPRDLRCHSEVDTRDKAMRLYNKLVLRTIKLRGYSFDRAYRSTRKWLRVSVFKFSDKKFHPREMTIEECKIAIKKIEPYVS